MRYYQIWRDADDGPGWILAEFALRDDALMSAGVIGGDLMTEEELRASGLADLLEAWRAGDDRRQMVSHAQEAVQEAAPKVRDLAQILAGNGYFGGYDDVWCETAERLRVIAAEADELLKGRFSDEDLRLVKD